MYRIMQWQSVLAVLQAEKENSYVVYIQSCQEEAPPPPEFLLYVLGSDIVLLHVDETSGFIIRVLFFL